MLMSGYCNSPTGHHRRRRLSLEWSTAKSSFQNQINKCPQHPMIFVFTPMSVSDPCVLGNDTNNLSNFKTKDTLESAVEERACGSMKYYLFLSKSYHQTITEYMSNLFHDYVTLTQWEDWLIRKHVLVNKAAVYFCLQINHLLYTFYFMTMSLPTSWHDHV